MRNILIFNVVILVYEIEVKTADKEKASTVHNGWLIIKGKKGETKMKMKNSARDKILRRYADLWNIKKWVSFDYELMSTGNNIYWFIYACMYIYSIYSLISIFRKRKYSPRDNIIFKWLVSRVYSDCIILQGRHQLIQP